jgi:hypothetical protein
VNKDRPKILTVRPDEMLEGHPHGQWVLDVMGGIINFACEIINDVPDVAPWAERLEAFRASSDETMEFESPHMPGRYFLHRPALDHIIMTNCAWSRKVLPRQNPNGDVELVDARSGVPLVRRKMN